MWYKNCFNSKMRWSAIVLIPNSCASNQKRKRLPAVLNRCEGMKRVCDVWSRGRHLSSSFLVGDIRYGSQKRSPDRNFGEHCLVRRSGVTSRDSVVLTFCLQFLPYSWKTVREGSTKMQCKDNDSL